MIKPTSIRVILTLALSRGWITRKLDVNNVFLNGELTEEVYLEYHASFEKENSKHLVCRLHVKPRTCMSLKNMYVFNEP